MYIKGLYSRPSLLHGISGRRNDTIPELANGTPARVIEADGEGVVHRHISDIHEDGGRPGHLPIDEGDTQVVGQVL